MKRVCRCLLLSLAGIMAIGGAAIWFCGARDCAIELPDGSCRLLLGERLAHAVPTEYEYWARVENGGKSGPSVIMRFVAAGTGLMDCLDLTWYPGTGGREGHVRIDATQGDHLEAGAATYLISLRSNRLFELRRIDGVLYECNGVPARELRELVGDSMPRYLGYCKRTSLFLRFIPATRLTTQMGSKGELPG